MGSPASLRRALALLAVGATALTAGTVAVPAVGTATAAPSHDLAGVHVRPASFGHHNAQARVAPLSTTQCVSQIGIHCYSPLQYRAAYNLNPLYQEGVTGKGRTIVIVDSFGSPTIQHDLEVFDKQWGIPDTNVEVVKWGNVPVFDPKNPDHTGWAGETTLDVEYAHAVAPDAHIILVETGVAETEGTTGLPEMMDAEKDLIKKGRGDVISQSFGATENTFPGYDKGDFKSLTDLRYAFKAAADHNVTVLGASGDNGATDAQANGSDLYPYKVNSWPSSDPLVTSIGGTQLTLDDNGNRTAADKVWHDKSGAGGGGVSGVFERPWYQAGVANVTGNHRGTPDISMSAAVDGAAWTYESYDPTAVGWHLTGGTSEATPIFSGVVALADQLAGYRLGQLNWRLYGLNLLPSQWSGIVDVKEGDNGWNGVTGYNATEGYDLASGLGTIDAAKFVHAIAGR
ncbi:subtilase family protein [Streptomyces sp. 1114.5]|uniref:S53 family peptidase n=1 Tax=unclassified Streptomyces TaxID=2593676 RepID=UPI000BD2DF00|nr:MULTISPECIES: S53 family peptidase [unclassified Streptomyces]RKT11790.1 subtilase family protein [Streptomyces sp. 1114.5]SOB80509.1 Subtilase family protein [Streptomyces sp. 1331.2]